MRKVATMTKALWLTDVHLNFLPAKGTTVFAKALAEDYPDADMAIITGDIAECNSFEPLIEEFAKAFGKPVRFVLGNHDAYGGSISEMRKIATRMKGLAQWLALEHVTLEPGVALVGADGWYDARNGDPKNSQVALNDFIYIKELAPFGGQSLFLELRKIADMEAAKAKRLLEGAIAAGHTKVVFATHVPPFALAAWHEGQVSDKHWLPWMSNRAMGDMLNLMAVKNSDIEFLVLCGHTHGQGTYKHGPNMIIHTGHSVYRSPRESGFIDLSMTNFGTFL